MKGAAYFKNLYKLQLQFIVSLQSNVKDVIKPSKKKMFLVPARLIFEVASLFCFLLLVISNPNRNLEGNIVANLYFPLLNSCLNL